MEAREAVEIIKDLPKGPSAPSAVALGFFDGMHLAHRAVIARAVEGRREGLVPCVFTFDPTQTVPDEKRKATRLQTPWQKAKILETLGIEKLFSPAFETVRMLDPKAFVEGLLAKAIGARLLVCGYNYHFGRGALGGVEDLRALCQPLGIRVEAIHPVTLAGDVVSSTRIRTAVRQGDLALAQKLLGGPFVLDTSVHRILTPVKGANSTGSVEGKAWGILQSFPSDFTLPPSGWYRSRLLRKNESLDAVSQVRDRDCVTWFDGQIIPSLGESFSVALLAALDNKP